MAFWQPEPFISGVFSF